MKKIILHVFAAAMLAVASLPVLAETAPATAPAAPTTNVDVVEWSIFIADALESQLNRRESFADSLPEFANDLRKPAPMDAAKAGTPGPIGVLRLHPLGKLPTDATIDVQLTYQSGRALGHWPTAKVRTQSLLWQDIRVGSGTALRAVPEDNWLAALRQESAPTLTVGNNSEPFLLYDVELNYAPRFEARAAGENQYRVWHGMDSPMLDLTFYKKDSTGRWLTASLPRLMKSPVAASQAANVNVLNVSGTATAPADSAANTTVVTTTITVPPGAVGVGQVAVVAVPGGGRLLAGPGGATLVKVTDAAAVPNGRPATAPAATEEEGTPITLTASADIDNAILQPWRTKLAAAGVSATDQAIALKILAQYALDPKRLTAIYQIDPAEFDKMLPLEVVPQPHKTSRIALVVLRGFDPAIGTELDDLIAQLGDPRWEKREAAMQEIKKLGAIAKVKLTKATSNKDLEIVMRAEQLLQVLNPTPMQTQN